MNNDILLNLRILASIKINQKELESPEDYILHLVYSQLPLLLLLLPCLLNYQKL